MAPHDREAITQLPGGLNLTTTEHRTLWQRSVPITKATVARLVRHGHLPSDQATDDLLQEGHLAAGRAILSWNPDLGAFSTWVSHNVARAVLKHARKEMSNRLDTFDDEDYISSKSDTVEKLLRRQAQERIMAALAGLPADDAKMLRGRYGLGCESRSILELARDRGVAPRTLKMHLRNVLMRIAPMLSQLTQQDNPHERPASIRS